MGATVFRKARGVRAAMRRAPAWRKNLWACTLVSFVVSAGMSQLAPILPLYIHELGVEGEEGLARWSGIVFGCNFISLAVFSPIWGALADRWGCKPMVLRACLGLSLCMLLVGLAQNVHQLAGLRLMQGVLSGFVGAVITLVASQTPQARCGWAMGVLASGMVSGSLVGPLLGGWLSLALGLRGNFFFMSACAFSGFLLLAALVRENFTPPERAASWRERLRLPLTRPLAMLFLTSFVSQFALMCMAPMITVYIRAMLPESDKVALISGVVFASAGLAGILFGAPSGRFMDRRGPERVLPLFLTVAGLLCLPQALARDPWTLAALRFFFGAAIVGVVPAINSLLKAHVRPEFFSRASSLNFSHQTLGIFVGSLTGGHVAAHFGPAAVFWLGAAVLFANACLFRRCFPKEEDTA